MSASPSRAVAAAYAAPAIPLGMLHFPVYVYLPPFYAAQGADLSQLAVVLLLVRLLDAVTDPAMGALSDRLRIRGERRRPWLALACLPLLGAAWMLLAPPEGAGAGHFALWLTALTLAWTMAATPYFAWGAELSTDYAGRAGVTAWREGAGLVGALLAAGLYAAGGADAGQGLFNVLLALAVLLPLATLAALRLAPEPKDWSRIAPARGLREVLRGLGEAFASPPFRRLLPAYLVNGLANGLPAALFLFYAEAVLGAPALAGPLLGLYFLAALIGAPFWVRLCRRLPKHRVWCAAMLWACAVFPFVLALGPGDEIAFAAISLLSGLALGADLAIPPAIQADVVDADLAERGEQRTGLHFAIWSVATKAALAVSGGAALWALDAAGFDAAAGAENAPGALRTLALLYGGAPVALKLVAIALMARFPLDRAGQEALRARIETGA